MKAWDVTIRATVRKIIRVHEQDLVEANKTEQEIVETAHSMFDVHSQSQDFEKYNEHVMFVKEIEI